MSFTGRKKWGVALAVAVAASAMATTTQAAPKPSAKPKQGGEIAYGIDATISGWCFANALSGGPLGATRLVYESLVDRDSKGNFVGQLAESWSSDATGKVWTFKLRPNIKYSNGEEFNAASVKQNMDIGRGLTTAAGWANSYASTGIGVNANIMSIDVVDNLTVKKIGRAHV